MRVLVACEESQIVCKAFRALGFDAFSCDLLPASGGFPEWHFQQDVRDLLNLEWDLVIAHPPCTDLAVSGARWFSEKRALGIQQKSIDFFMLFTSLDHVKHVAIENPVCIMSSLYRKPDQIIQPWQFGHGETKKTCLWLKDLPLLVPTDVVPGRVGRVWRLPPSSDRSLLRSKTYPGIASAMALQWGNYLIERR